MTTLINISDVIGVALLVIAGAYGNGDERKQKLEDEGFSASDVDKLTDLAFTTPSLDGLIGIGPSGNSRELVRNIYQESLKA